MLQHYLLQNLPNQFLKKKKLKTTLKLSTSSFSGQHKHEFFFSFVRNRRFPGQIVFPLQYEAIT